MDAQLTELLTNYGPIGGIWFDGWWDKPDADWQLERQYTLIHRLQPGCLIGNNHHKAPFDGEDFQMFERDLPGQNKAGYSADAEISALPLESCETMNNTWGYNINDRNFKSTKQLIHTLVGAAGNNANLLLNVGPRPGGDFPEGSARKCGGAAGKMILLLYVYLWQLCVKNWKANRMPLSIYRPI